VFFEPASDDEGTWKRRARFFDVGQVNGLAGFGGQAQLVNRHIRCIAESHSEKGHTTVRAGTGLNKAGLGWALAFCGHGCLFSKIGL
jgi:hypothetical protein